MTVVVRPAAATHNFTSPADVSDIHSSRETNLKVDSIIQFFEDHYKKIENDAVERNARHQRMLEKLENIPTEQQEEYFQRFVREEMTYTRAMRTRLKAERYVRLKMIGRGGYGEVWLAGDTITRELLALKVLKKAKIILDKQVMNVRSERDVLSISKNPWIVELKYSFQDQEYLYLALEFVQGGDLMGLLMNYQTFSPNWAAFYIAEIVLAINSVHKMGYLHRDLKPENILICANGHIKLTDFGLATNYSKPEIDISLLIEQLNIEQIDDFSFIRTPRHNRNNNTQAFSLDYAAPELLCGEKATTASDYWALGVILYEMIYGCPPFYDEKKKNVIAKILNWRTTLAFPCQQNATQDVVDLMFHLLCEPSERYGFEQIISHPFFKEFNFKNPFLNTPPVTPSIKSPTDSSHFENFEPSRDQTCGHIPLSDLAQFAFVGFTYKPRPANSILLSLQ